MNQISSVNLTIFLEKCPGRQKILKMHWETYQEADTLKIARQEGDD